MTDEGSSTKNLNNMIGFKSSCLMGSRMMKRIGGQIEVIETNYENANGQTLDWVTYR